MSRLLSKYCFGVKIATPASQAERPQDPRHRSVPGHCDFGVRRFRPDLGHMRNESGVEAATRANPEILLDNIYDQVFCKILGPLSLIFQSCGLPIAQSSMAS